MLLRFFTAVVLLCLSLTASAYQNEPDGFRGIVWGEDFASHSKEMKLVGASTGSEDRIYKRNKDRLAVGDAEIKEINYSFWNGRLASVFLFSSGYSNKSALLAALRAQFGEPVRPNQYLDKYWWLGEITTIELKCGPVGEDCHVLLSSKAIGDLKQGEASKRASAAGKDF